LGIPNKQRGDYDSENNAENQFLSLHFESMIGANNPPSVVLPDLDLT